MNNEPSTTNQFVSRGGLKLQHAIENFKISIENLVVLDVGSSTGGFVDCLLKNGAQLVYSVDTAYGELAWTLRNDKRVVVMERTNILHLKELPVIKVHANRSVSSGDPNALGEEEGHQMPDQSGNDKQKVDLVTIDASWTKLELILPVVSQFLKENGSIIALLKPHYEAGKQLLVKGVLPEEKTEEITQKVIKKIENLNFQIENVIESPILGGGGNREFLLLIKPKI